MTDLEAYSLGMKDGEDGIPPWPPVKEGRLHDAYFRGYTAGRRVRR